jgi:hypothetical protein
MTVQIRGEAPAPRPLVAPFFARADEGRAETAADPFPAPPTYQPVDVTGWSLDDLDALADDDAATEALYDAAVAAWEERHQGHAWGTGAEVAL